MSCNSQNTSNSKRFLLIETFYGGSHKQLIDFLVTLLNGSECDLLTLPAKKWHWRARTGALFMSKNISKTANYHTIFCSSTLNLAELLALRPELHTTRKIVYFHENQFIYPQQLQQDRDFQYGYSTILSALVADHVIFNSHYNLNTFLENIDRHLRKQPDFRMDGLKNEIAPKTTVIYFPITISPQQNDKTYDILHIVWPHRWEHDKGPDLFFRVLYKLKDENLRFRVSVLGESHTDPMPVFGEARTKLSQHINHFGRLESTQDYRQVLRTAHVVVSTARHEFFGVAMLEAVHCGCLPLAPNSLVYPEIYPKQYLYNTEQQLFKRLQAFCKNPNNVRHWLKSHPIELSAFHYSAIVPHFQKLFEMNAATLI